MGEADGKKTFETDRLDRFWRGSTRNRVPWWGEECCVCLQVYGTCTDSVRLLPIYAAVAVRGYFQKVLCLMVVVLESVRLLRTTTTTTTTTISCSDGCRIDATTEVYPSPTVHQCRLPSLTIPSCSVAVHAASPSLVVTGDVVTFSPCGALPQSGREWVHAVALAHVPLNVQCRYRHTAKHRACVHILWNYHSKKIKDDRESEASQF